MRHLRGPRPGPKKSTALRATNTHELIGQCPVNGTTQRNRAESRHSRSSFTAFLPIVSPQYLAIHLANYTRIFAIQFVVVFATVLTLLGVSIQNFVLINYFAPVLPRAHDSMLDHNDASNPGISSSRTHAPNSPLLIYDRGNQPDRSFRSLIKPRKTVTI